MSMTVAKNERERESEERCKENDANLLRQLKESEERSKENDVNLLGN